MTDTYINGRSLRLFLIDGTATGLITAEIINWTGHALVAPMSRLQDLVKRSETSRSGIYFLIGDDPEDPTRQKLYIGESDNVRDRLYQHQKSDTKDYVLRVCVITSKDTNLTKGHVRYLEARLIEMAADADRVTLDNGTRPPRPSLPEADIADMEFFLSQVAIVLPVVQFDILRPKRPPVKVEAPSQTTEAADYVTLVLKRPSKGGVLAEAIYKDSDFVVLKGAVARDDNPDATNHYRQLRQSLIENGKLTRSVGGSEYTLTDDVSFKSPSAAAAVLLDRNANGRSEWRLKSGEMSLKEYQESLLPAQGEEE